MPHSKAIILEMLFLGEESIRRRLGLALMPDPLLLLSSIKTVQETGAPKTETDCTMLYEVTGGCGARRNGGKRITV